MCLVPIRIKKKYDKYVCIKAALDTEGKSEEEKRICLKKRKRNEKKIRQRINKAKKNNGTGDNSSNE